MIDKIQKPANLDSPYLLPSIFRIIFDLSISLTGFSNLPKTEL